jgi:hypothetical protein
VGDVHDAFQGDDCALVDFGFVEPFRVVAEIAQKPGELPQCLVVAQQPTFDVSSRELLRFYYREMQPEVRTSGIIAVSNAIYAHQVEAVGQRLLTGHSLFEPRYVAIHAASF